MNLSRRMIARMARQSLKASRLHNAFVMATIVLASALLTALLMYGMGSEVQTREQIRSSPQAGFYNLTREQAVALSADSRIARKVLAKQGPVSELSGMDVVPCYVSSMTEGIHVGSLSSGRLPEALDEIAAPPALLERMGAVPQIGAGVSLSFQDGSTQSFTVCGLLADGETDGPFSLLFSPEYAQNGSLLRDVPYELYAQFYGATELDAETCKEMVAQVGADAGVERRNIQPDKAFLDSLSVDTGMVLLVMLVGMVILLACVLVVYGVFYLSVTGQIRQFGQLRTLGMTRNQIKKLISREGAALFLRAAPAGLLAWAAAGYAVLPEGFRAVNLLLAMAAAFAIMFAVTMGSVLRPARMAAAVSPMEAMRYVPQDEIRRGGSRGHCRRLTPWGMGGINFSRNKKKAAVTLLSLCLGGVLFVTASVYLSSFDREAYGRQGDFAHAEFRIGISPEAAGLDVHGMSGIQSENPLDDAFCRAVRALDGVDHVQEHGELGVQFDFSAQEEYGIEDRIAPTSGEEIREIGTYLESGSADPAKLMSGQYVLIAGNSTVEEIYGWSFRPGDRLVFHYYDGERTAQREVEVLGLLNDSYTINHGAPDGWFLMPEPVLRSWVSYPCLNTRLLVSLSDMEQEQAVEAELAQMVAQHPELELSTLSENVAIHKAAADSIFSAISGLSILIMMFSLMSMVNTLITNMVARRHEIAVLESVGMGRGQVRRMLMGENLLLEGIVLTATVGIGTLLGWILCRILNGMGAFYMIFRFPWELLMIYAAVLILIPAAVTGIALRRFSRQTLAERIREAGCV